MTPKPPARPAGPNPAQRLVRAGYRLLAAGLRSFAGGRWESAQTVTIGIVWLAAGPVIAGCGLVDLARGGPDVVQLVLAGAVVTVAGVLVARLSSFPKRLDAAQLFTSLVLGAVAAIAALVVAHLATGTTSSLTVALVESTAAITATNVSTLDPFTMSDGMLLLRALAQWVAGAAVIVMVVRVLPHLGTGGLDSDGGVATRAARRISPRVGGTLYRFLVLYSGLTVLMAIAFFAAGMPLLDSGLHALSTLSTGGFSTQPGSIGAYDSAAIEWVTVVGMLLAGCSLPLVFLAVRNRDPRRFLRSLEFRLYVVLIVFVAFSIVVWSDGPIDLESVRRAIFAATSSVSTTGFVAGDWTALPGGGQVLLSVLMAVGGMGASVAGGFKVVRLLALTGYVRREMVRNLHPQSVFTVHLGRSSISDLAMSRIVGDVMLSILVLAVGVVALAASGLGGVAGTGESDGVLSVVSFAISALSNVGPAFGPVGTSGHLSALDGPGHLVAAALMFVGRVAVTPALVTVAVLARPVHRRVRFRRRAVSQDGAR